MAIALNPDTVRFDIDKAREFYVEEEVTIAEEPLSPSEDWAQLILADYADDPTIRELKSTCEDFEPDQQAALAGLL